MKRILFVLSEPSEVVQLAPIIYLLQDQYAEAIESRWINVGGDGAVVQRTAKVFGLGSDGELTLAGHNPLASDYTWSVNQAMHRVMDSWQPNMVVVQGASSYAVIAAQQAFVRRIPVLHVFGGLRLVNGMLEPKEQANRRMLSALANFRCVSTPADLIALRQEGFAGYEIGVTGNPALDALGFLGQAAPVPHPFMAQHPEDVATRLQSGRLLIVIKANHESNESLTEVVLAVSDIAAAYPGMDFTVALSGTKDGACHNLNRSILRSIPRVSVFQDLLYDQLVSLIAGHELVLTDSYDVLDLAAALGRPVLLTHDIERYEDWPQTEAGKPIGNGHDQIYSGLRRVLSEPDACEDLLSRIHSNGDGFAAARIGRLIGNWVRNGILTPMAFEPFRGAAQLTTHRHDQQVMC